MALYDSKDAVIYTNQYEITEYTTEASLAGARPLHEATTFGDGGATFAPAVETATFSWTGFYDDGASGSEVILNALKGATSESVVSYAPAGDSISSLVMASGNAWVTEPTTDASVGSLVGMSANFNLGEATRSKSTGAKSTVTATTSGTSIDDASSSSSGGSWIYHVLAVSASGGNAQWQVKFQHSSNNSSWTDITSVNISAVGAAKTAFTGTFNRYVRQRVVLDASSGSITFAVSYNRA